jgi:hypothetical protein
VVAFMNRFAIAGCPVFWYIGVLLNQGRDFLPEQLSNITFNRAKYESGVVQLKGQSLPSLMTVVRYGYKVSGISKKRDQSLSMYSSVLFC